MGKFQVLEQYQWVGIISDFKDEEFYEVVFLAWLLESSDTHLSDFEFAAHFMLSLNAHIFQSGLRWSEFEVLNYVADLKATLLSF